MLWVGEKGARVRRRTRRRERRRLTRRREVEAPTEPPRPNTKTCRKIKNQEEADKELNHPGQTLTTSVKY